MSKARSILLFLVLFAATANAAPRQVAAPEIFRKWPIAFVRNGNIWTAKADGSGQRLAIKHAGVPCWSPDKKRLAFYRDGNIWVANADGSRQRQLTHFGKRHRFNSQYVTITWNSRTGGITFSRPDWIRTVSQATGVTYDAPSSVIFDLYPVDTGKPRLSVRFDITDCGSGFNFADNDNPAWSKSGKELAFTRNGDIWLAEYVPEEGGGRAGWDITRLAPVAVYDSPTNRCSREIQAVTHLSWSPDGKRLAYCLNRIGGSGTADLHVITLGRHRGPQIVESRDKKLLDEFNLESEYSGFQAKHACFSPDGNWIAFSSGNTIYAISSDGERIVKLISNAWNPAL